MASIALNYASQELTEVPKELLKFSKVENLVLDFNSIAFIPPKVCQHLSLLSFLSLNGNFLKSLPAEIDQISSLNELYLKENELLSLPETIGNLKFLEKLHLTGNQLKKFPENIALLKNLKELIADENEIETLPSHFGNIISLMHLDLSSNKLRTLCADFGSLRNLRDLNLSCNYLTDLPSSFGDIPSLEVMDLTHNKISILPEKLSCSKILKKFLIAHNSVVSLPLWFDCLENIEEILLGCNDLQANPFPEKFGDVSTCLQHLDLSGNQITILPQSFGNLANLEYLDLGSPEDELERNRILSNGNSVTFLPKTFPNLLNLTNLQLDENEIMVLPEDFGRLENITYLDLSHNILKTLPDSFCQLKIMRVCMLSMNHISRLPNDFGLLTELEDLKLDSNLLTEVPDSFECLTELVDLDLYNNKFTEIPKCLNVLKKLKHLDIRENNIDLGLDELPEIFYEPSYLIRNPEYSNNWRGRKRPDIQPNFWIDSKENKTSFGSIESDVLFQALKASSQWRKHGQTTRSKDPKMADLLKDGLQEDSKEENASQGYFSCTLSTTESTPSSDFDNDDLHLLNEDSLKVLNCNSDDAVDDVCEEEFWDKDFLHLSPCEMSSHSVSEDSDAAYETEDLSDWESEIIFECPKNFERVYRHPIEHCSRDASVFVPSDIHPPPVRRVSFWYPFEEGQFEDADS